MKVYNSPKKKFPFREHSKIILAEIPEEWDITNIGKISNHITKGTTPTTEGSAFVEHGIPFFKVESFDDEGNVVEEKLEKIDQETHMQLKRSQLKPNDILFSIAGTLGRIYRIEEKYDQGNTNQAIAIIRLKNDSYSNEFLEHFLHSFMIKKQIMIEKTVLAQPNLSLPQVSNLQIVKPSLPEQKNIAKILSKANFLIRKNNELVDSTLNFKKAMNQFIFKNGTRNEKISNHKIKFKKDFECPKSWKLINLGKLVKFSAGSFLPESQQKSGKIPVYGGNGITGYHDKSLIDFDTIVFGRVGAYCGSTYFSKDKSWITDNAIYIKKLSKEINIEYLYRFLSRLKIGTLAEVTAQPKITHNILEHILLRYPKDVEEQKEIVQIFSNVDSRLKSLEIKGIFLKNLRTGLMQKLFTGKIRVKF